MRELGLKNRKIDSWDTQGSSDLVVQSFPSACAYGEGRFALMTQSDGNILLHKGDLPGDSRTS